jgi:prevent-host-death family protein
MDDAVILPFSPAERELLAELDDTARCSCGGEGRPAVHQFPPCAARLIKRLQAEIVSLQVLAEDALAPVSQLDSRQGGACEHATRLLGELFRAAFVGAGLGWSDTRDAGMSVLVDCLVEAIRGEDIEPRRRQVNISDAKATLSRLVEQANSGEVIIIARNGRPVARLAPLSANDRGQRDAGDMTSPGQQQTRAQQQRASKPRGK